MLTVGLIRRAIEGLPDEAPVIVQYENLECDGNTDVEFNEARREGDTLVFGVEVSTLDLEDDWDDWDQEEEGTPPAGPVGEGRGTVGNQ